MRRVGKAFCFEANATEWSSIEGNRNNVLSILGLAEKQKTWAKYDTAKLAWNMFIEFIKFLAKLEWESCNMWKALKIMKGKFIEQKIGSKIQEKSLLDCWKKLIARKTKMIFLLSKAGARTRKQMIAMFMGRRKFRAIVFEFTGCVFQPEEKRLIGGGICRWNACCYQTDCSFLSLLSFHDLWKHRNSIWNFDETSSSFCSRLSCHRLASVFAYLTTAFMSGLRFSLWSAFCFWQF